MAEVEHADSTAVDEPQVNRVGTIIALVLALILVVGVLGVSKFVYYRAAHQPVALNSIDAPGAQSQECKGVISNVPQKLGSFDRVDISDPAPAGAAVWVKSSDRVTLRCGVQPPTQYSSITPTEKHGISWMAIGDTTGTDTVTWYSLGLKQQIAVTGPSSIADSLADLTSALKSDPESKDSATAKPGAVPLSSLSTVSAEDYSKSECSTFISHLPEKLGSLKKTTTDTSGQALPQGIVAWVGPRREPVVMRCGVSEPSDYKPGVTLQQVNQVAWFNSQSGSASSEASSAGSSSASDSVSGSGSTASASGSTSETDSLWYAMGYEPTVALSLPAGSGNDAITQLSSVIADQLHKTGS